MRNATCLPVKSTRSPREVSNGKGLLQSPGTGRLAIAPSEWNVQATTLIGSPTRDYSATAWRTPR